LKKEDRELKNHQGYFVLFTGLSGAGKSTLAVGVEKRLKKMNINTFHLDGDILRNGLNKDLGFTPEDRKENIRRLAEIGKLFIDAGMITLASFIAPIEVDRENIKKTIGKGSYIEIFVSTPMATCENRDVKGLYKKARKGEIPNFTGIGSPYEEPISPNFIIDTTGDTIEESIDKICNSLLEVIK
jgi:adenylylsulfate kinase